MPDLCQFKLNDKLVCGRELVDSVHVICARCRQQTRRFYTLEGLCECFNVQAVCIPCHIFQPPSAGVQVMDEILDALFAPIKRFPAGAVEALYADVSDISAMHAAVAVLRRIEADPGDEIAENLEKAEVRNERSDKTP